MSLAILNVGEGDTKITFDKDKPEERERACRIVVDMLRRGFALLVAAGERDGRPLYFRATTFDPETAEYIVAGLPEDEPAPVLKAEERPAPRRRGRPPGSGKRLPAETTRAVAVARSAGGMSDRADSIEVQNLRRFDPYAQLRGQIGVMAEMRDEWAGIPMPLDDFPLVVEPKFPRAAALMAFGRAAQEQGEEDAKPQPKILNRFYSARRRCDIVIWQEPDGRREWGVHRAVHHFDQELSTLGASVAWGIEQEHAALQTLATLIRHHQMKQYLLTGQFLESSSRSGMTYMFRKLRPTIAMAVDGEQMRIRTALCMHPIAYYSGTWAGAMCPTDDVIAHLMLMRGDEALYWRRCNQHPAWRPEAGL